MAKVVNVAEFRSWLEELAGKPYEGWEELWHKVLKALRVSFYYVLPIQELLKLDVWKAKPNPLNYMRKSAKRMARRMGLAGTRRDREREVLACELTYTGVKQGKGGHDDKLGVALLQHEKKHGPDDGPLPAMLYPPEVLTPNLQRIDWGRVAAMADLDEGERLVLELRRTGFSRPLLMQACLCDFDRKILQAAWRRLDRKRLLLKKIIKTGKGEPARRLETRERWQMCLMEMEDKTYRIFFREMDVEDIA